MDPRSPEGDLGSLRWLRWLDLGVLEGAGETGGELCYQFQFAGYFWGYLRFGQCQLRLQEQSGYGGFQFTFKQRRSGPHSLDLLFPPAPNGGLDLGGQPRTAMKREVDLHWNRHTEALP